MNCILCNAKTTEKNFSKINVNKCQSCSFEFFDSSAFRDSDYFKNYYSSLRVPDNEKMKLREKQYKIDSKIIQDHMSPSKSLLDIGCSNGGFIYQLNKLGYTNLTGIDIDVSAIDYANEHYSDCASFYTTLLHKFDSEKKYDCFIFRGTLQYLGFDLHAAFEKILTLANPNAKIIILSLPNSDSTQYQLFEDEWHLFNYEGHSLIFNLLSLKTLGNIYKMNMLNYEYPYIETIYQNVKKDVQSFKENILSNSFTPHAFWGNMIECVFQL